MLKTTLLAAVASTAMAVDYSSVIDSVIAANTAKLITTGTTTSAINNLATLNGLAAAEAAATVINTHFGTAGPSAACELAYRTAHPFHATFTWQAMNDMNMFYSYRYIDEVDYDNHVTLIKACLDAESTAPTNLADLKTSLDAAKAALVIYPGKIDLDFTVYTNTLNTGNTVIPLSTTEAASFYTTSKLQGSAYCYSHVYENTDGGATKLVPGSNTVLSTAISDIIALETSWTATKFPTLDTFSYYMVMEDRKDLLGMTSEIDLIVKHRDAIYTAYGYSATSVPTLAVWQAAYGSYEACQVLVKSELLAAETTYNGAAFNTAGVLAILVIGLVN